MQGTRGEIQGYEPFGSLLPGRNYSTPSYNFGFNGKLKDDEVHGATGTSYDYGFRMYDSRIGRFVSIDPLTAKYPFYSPYQFAGNSPIEFIDLDGLERAKNKKNTGKTALQIYTEKHGDVDIYDPKSSYGNKRKHDPTGWGFGQIFHSLIGRKVDRTTEPGGGVIENPLERQSSQGEDRTLDNRVNLYPKYNDGNIKLEYNPGTDENGNPVTGTYEIGVVDTDGNEHPIATTKSNKPGSIAAAFKLNAGEYLYQRTISTGTGASTKTSATATKKSNDTDDGQ